MTWSAENADYDLRQLRLAVQAIDGYASSGRSLVDLGRLVSSLEALSAALESPDEDWARRFGDEVLGLETVYAVRIDRGGELDDGDAKIVQSAIDHLRKLVASAVASLEALTGEAA